MTLYIDGVETEIAPNIINELLRGYADWRKLLGPEKVTNGGFTGAATGWTLGAGWTYNANAVDRDGAGTATLTQDVGAVAKELYKVVFVISNYVDGSVTPSIGGVSGDAVSSAITSTQYILATGTGVLTFTPTAGATFTLDNVSVKKVGYVAVDGVTLFVDDRGATAGKGALHMMTEDGTRYVFGDRMGFGTFNPGSALEIVGNLLINIGAFALTLTHGITAARTITFPDATGTVALLGLAQTWDAIQDIASGLKSTAHADVGDATNYFGSVYTGYVFVGTALSPISGARLYTAATVKHQSASGVIGYSVVNTDFTLGSLGTIKIPVGDMVGAANDAARDALAGNISGAICGDAAAGFLYVRIGTAWYKATLAAA